MMMLYFQPVGSSKNGGYRTVIATDSSFSILYVKHCCKFHFVSPPNPKKVGALQAHKKRTVTVDHNENEKCARRFIVVDWNVKSLLDI